MTEPQPSDSLHALADLLIRYDHNHLGTQSAGLPPETRSAVAAFSAASNESQRAEQPQKIPMWRKLLNGIKNLSSFSVLYGEPIHTSQGRPVTKTKTPLRIHNPVYRER